MLDSLNNPNSGATYWPGRGLVRALVLELVDRETLAQRISRGPIPLDEGFVLAREIDGTLEYAHERGERTDTSGAHNRNRRFSPSEPPQLAAK